MNKRMKRLVSVLCALVLLVGLAPMTLAAEEVETPAPHETGEEAGLLASCCSAATPHPANATIEYPTGGTEHYCVASTGSYVNINLQLVGDAVGSSVAKSGLSNVDASGTNGLYKYKHKVTNGGTATWTLKKNSVETVITLHMVDPNAHVHVFDDGVVTRQATCGADGERLYTCTAAGCSNPPYTETEVIPATGKHTWSDQYATLVEPTCTTKGLEGKACANCDAISETETREIDMIPHTYKNGEFGICLVCNRESATGAQHTHIWAKPAGADADGWVVDKAATCQETGTKHRTCSNADCGKVETVTIPKTAHDFSNGVCPGCGQTQTEVAGNMADQGGALESAWIEWPIQSGVYRYEVYVKEASATSYPDTPIDGELIRRYPGDLMRADALGLKGSASGINYKMKVVAYDKSGNELPAMELESGLLTVYAHIREGYAFWDKSTYKTGSGAYNDDGTLKSNAVVVYVSNDNFNTVKVTAGGHSFTGVQAMVGDGESFSTLLPGTPLCIRILGTIDLTGFPTGSWGSSEEGLQIKGAKPYTNKNLTIEGVGNDGSLNSFGILLRNCGNVEIRNLGVFNCKDDSISIDTDNCNLWIHNNDLFYGQDGGGDKAKGDGALDTKQSKQITHSFNHFWDNGKCNLQGMKSETTDNTITYHHNWFDHSDSRHPRVRTGTIHVYNNYYDGNAKYGVGATMGSSVFVENNYFRNCKNPMMIADQGTDAAGAGTFSGEAGGMIKAYNNTILGAKSYIPYTSGTDFDAYEAKSRDEQVMIKNASGNGYNNFDTANDFYSYTVQTPEDAKNTTVQWAGRVQGGDFKWTFDNATEDANYAVIPELREAVTAYRSPLVSVGGVVEGGISSGPISVSKVTLNMTSLSLKPGTTGQLTATVTPSTATDKAVSWKSSAPAVATVDDDGLVTAVANGSANITVTTDDGGKTATCAVTVSNGGSTVDPDPPAPSETTETLDNLLPSGEDLTYTRNSDGDITMTSVPTGHKVIAAYSKDGKFMGARVMDSSDLTAAAVPGWTLLKLFWLNDKAVPQSAAAEIDSASEIPTPTPDTPRIFTAGSLTAAADKETLTNADLGNGFTAVFAESNQITKRIDSKGNVISVEVVKAAGSAIQFTVTKGPATAELKVSSTGGVNWSAVRLEKQNGAAWDPVNATIAADADLKLFGASASVVLVHNTTAKTVNYANLQPGTYRVVVPDMGEDLYTKHDGTPGSKTAYEALTDTTADKAEKGLYPFNRNLRIQSVTVTESK